MINYWMSDGNVTDCFLSINVRRFTMLIAGFSMYTNTSHDNASKTGVKTNTKKANPISLDEIFNKVQIYLFTMIKNIP